MGTREVLFEFIPMGRSVKVCAVDSATLVEVSIVGPARAGPAELKRTALAKLRYVLARRTKERETPGGTPPGVLA